MLTKRFLLAAPFALMAQSAWADAPAFEVGQIWSLKAPEYPEGRVRIGRIEGSTIHISLWGVPSPFPNADENSFVASHLPVSAAALAQSVDRIVEATPPENLGFEDGYQTWRREANGAAFSITVPEIIEVIYQSVRGGQ